MAGFFKKLFTKFSRSSRIDWEELEAELVAADIGIRRAMGIADQLKESKGLDAENLVESTREVLRRAFPSTAPSLPVPPEGKPLVILVVGVNGTGKTTSAVKLAQLLQKQGSRVLLAANRGDVLAMDEAGLFYMGSGIILDYEEGVKWLAKGAFYEYWKALYDLGMFYHEYNFTEDREKKALTCFQKAAEFHDSESEYMLGLDGAMKARTDKDLEKAISWLEKSFDHGNEEAALLLGNLYEGTVDTDMEIRESPEKARRWYEKAAGQGSGEAMAELAFYYEKGLTVERDMKKAVNLLKDAAINGYEEGLFSLALLYLENGKEDEALPYMEAAAAKGEERALYMTGMMYLYGKGTEPDREKGIDYLKGAADQGSEEAVEELQKQGVYAI